MSATTALIGYLELLSNEDNFEQFKLTTYSFDKYPNQRYNQKGECGLLSWFRLLICTYAPWGVHHRTCR